MKLAEALQERADLNRRIAQLRSRLESNALVQEGEKPAEDPNDLWQELLACANRLEALMTQINLRNSQTLVEGQTLTALMAKRDCLRLKADACRELAEQASQLASRAAHTEIRILSAVDVRALQKQADGFAAELRRTDNLIQMTNWATEL